MDFVTIFEVLINSMPFIGPEVTDDNLAVDVIPHSCNFRTNFSARQLTTIVTITVGQQSLLVASSVYSNGVQQPLKLPSYFCKHLQKVIHLVRKLAKNFTGENSIVN